MHVGCKQCQTKNAVVLIVTAVYCLTLEMTRLVMTYEVCQAFKGTVAGFIHKQVYFQHVHCGCCLRVLHITDLQSNTHGAANSALQVCKPLVRGSLLYLLASYDLYNLVAGT